MVRRSYLVQTSAVIYRHAMIETSTSTGFARPATDGVTGTFVGIAEDIGNITYPITGDGSTVYVYVINNIDVLLPTATAITVGNTGVSTIYAADDQTATAAVSAGPVIGVMVNFVATNSAWIALRETTAAVAAG